MTTQAGRRVRLTGSRPPATDEEGRNTWRAIIGDVVQRSLVDLADRRKLGKTDPEGMVFLQRLCEVATRAEDDGYHRVAQRGLFGDPMGAYTLQLLDREFVCVEYTAPAAHSLSPGEQPTNRLNDAMKTLTEQLSSVNTDLEEDATSRELLAVIFDHIHEKHGENAGEANVATPDLHTWEMARPVELHSARRAALRNWEARLKRSYQEAFDHGDEERPMYAYPYVDLVAPDSQHLVLLMVTPLDENFVDDKVDLNRRVPEMTVGIFSARNRLYRGGIDQALPLLKYGFARILFTNMLRETDHALAESFEERAAILRHWVTLASGGIHGLLDERRAKAPFDAFLFCDAVVRKALCARIPKVTQTEVYPFDRVFIFKEAGTSNRISDEPIEVLVLEASIISKAAADRGRYLTSRERRIRGTENYECDPAQKRLGDENRFRFYVHQGRSRRRDGRNSTETLILSRRGALTRGDKERILRDTTRSRGEFAAETSGYPIVVPPIDRMEDLPLCASIYNLFGRLIASQHVDKHIPSPVTGKEEWPVTTFSEAFERMRLQVLNRASENGLYYHHEQGVDLEHDAPLLHALQTAYRAYLDDHFERQDRAFQRDKYRQENMSAQDVEAAMEEHEAQRTRAKAARSVRGPDEDGSARTLRSKVVYVSFSWDLHDENTKRMLAREAAGRDDADEEARALLGPEYTYTMVLVADRDEQKSVARLTAEREDLRLFFQMVMDRIWMDRRNEHDYLDKRSRSIAANLHQFVHRVKYLVAPEKQGEIDLFHSQLKGLMQVRRPQLQTLGLGSCEQLFARLTGGSDVQRLSAEGFAGWLEEQAASWADGRGGECTIEVLPSGLPELQVLWADGVVHDGFTVLVKNAVEAAVFSGAAPARVTIQVQAGPALHASYSGEWALDLLVVNTGGPIPKGMLRELNRADPVAIPKQTKKGSTGVGVFLTRFQLQEVIGGGAELTLSNLEGGLVQGRLRLPAGPAIADQEHILVARDADPEGAYVLYVEDASEFSTPALEHLRPLASRQGIQVVHRRGVSQARQDLQRKLPILLMTDLNIVNREDEAACEEKHGLNLIKAALAAAGRAGEHPPIWVMTQEAESRLHKRLGSGDLHGYRFIPRAAASVEELASPGTICVFSGVKRPDELQPGLLERVLSSGRGPAAGELPGSPPAGVEAEYLDLEGPELTEGLQDWLDESGTEPETLLVVRTKGSSRKALADSLARWFGHNGIRDRDATVEEDPETYRLTDHVYHKRLVLAAALGRRLARQVPPQLVYWALCRNVWLDRRAQADPKLAGVWASLVQEEKGPLSRLRHDLLNLCKQEGLAGRSADIKRVLTECEAIISLPESASNKLEEALLRGEGAAEVIRELLGGPKQVEAARTAAEDGLREVDQMLTSLKDRGVGATGELAQARLTVHVLRQLLGVAP